jgi:hypothetical protein
VGFDSNSGKFKSAQAMGLLGLAMGVAFAVFGKVGPGGGGALLIGVVMGMTGIVFLVYGRLGTWRHHG